MHTYFILYTAEDLLLLMIHIICFERVPAALFLFTFSLSVFSLVDLGLPRYLVSAFAWYWKSLSTVLPGAVLLFDFVFFFLLVPFFIHGLGAYKRLRCVSVPSLLFGMIYLRKFFWISSASLPSHWLISAYSIIMC